MTKADLTAPQVRDNWIWWPPVEERWICWPHCSLARIRWLGENGESRERERAREEERRMRSESRVVANETDRFDIFF